MPHCAPLRLIAPYCALLRLVASSRTVLLPTRPSQRARRERETEREIDRERERESPHTSPHVSHTSPAGPPPTVVVAELDAAQLAEGVVPEAAGLVVPALSVLLYI